MVPDLVVFVILSYFLVESLIAVVSAAAWSKLFVSIIESS